MDDHPVEAGLTFTTTEKIAIGITSPIWVLLSLIALVFGAPAVGVMAVKSMLENRNKILKYEEDKCAFMKEAGMMKTKNGDEQTVALKIYAESLTAENVSDIVNKFELLKKLNHPNVVTFHGMSFMKDDGQTRIILIMEYCMGNLKDHILKNPEITPAKSKNADAKRDACDSGYPCKLYLMTPYLNPVTDKQQEFNSAHKRTREAIEQAFGWWKRRFHLLHSEIRMKPEKVSIIIGACDDQPNLVCFHGPEDDKVIRDHICNTFI
ncbi:hypothetical protein AWC38_SpisGene13438 [Stylophora pistillata]|uniref:Protein kinase domain-containing protein n=1 Tax=Stylophora pistillata TaxID=50429 RepID=A0A2B4RWQ8_STYPI|nr:hypothetical protein AWC38_SpisGene13438 [Stylophora pistillata]